MFLRFTRTEDRRVLDNGYVVCPECKSEQPYKLFQIVEQTRLFIIPINYGDEIGRYIECLNCHNRFKESDFTKKDSNGRIKIATWDCPTCGNLNLNSSYKCTKCDYSLI